MSPPSKRPADEDDGDIKPSAPASDRPWWSRDKDDKDER